MSNRTVDIYGKSYIFRSHFTMGNTQTEPNSSFLYSQQKLSYRPEPYLTQVLIFRFLNPSKRLPTCVICYEFQVVFVECKLKIFFIRSCCFNLMNLTVGFFPMLWNLSEQFTWMLKVQLVLESNWSKLVSTIKFWKWNRGVNWLFWIHQFFTVSRLVTRRTHKISCICQTEWVPIPLSQ